MKKEKKEVKKVVDAVVVDNNSDELDEKPEHEVEKVDTKKPVLPKKSIDIKSILLIVLVFLLVAIIGESVALYGFKKDDNSFVKAIGTVLPFPLAMVEMRPVYMSDYWNELGLVLKTCEAAGTDCQITQKDRIDISNNLIMEKVIFELADSYGISVSDEKLTEEFNKIIEENGGEDELKKILLEKYNWSVDDFRQRVYISLLAKEMEETLIEKIDAKHLLIKTNADASEEDIQKAKEKAQEALDRINNGDDFDTVVTEMSEDETTKDNGGDLGYFARGVMIPEFENIAFDLNVGEVSDLVQTDFGWHIIKLVDKKGEVKSNFMNWLEEQKNNMHIWRFFDVGESEEVQ